MTEQDARNTPESANAKSPSVYARRRTVLVVVVVLALAAAGVLGVLGYQSFAKRLEAARKLDRATVLVEEADALVVKIDESVRATVTAEAVEATRDAKAEVPEAEQKLEQAVGLIDEALPDLTDDERERGDLLRDSAEARRQMLDHAPSILDANAQAGSAIPFADSAWEAVLAADGLSTRAVTAYNKLTRAGVQESQKLNQEASSQLAQARSGFDSAEKAFSAAPLELFLAYVDTRIRLNKLSLRSDKAWLDGDLTDANQLIEEYNREDRKAVAQAKDLPATPVAAIASSHESITASASAQYGAARERAVQADERVKDF